MSRISKEDLKSFFWTIALILFIRGFIVEPFKIPSGSMIPTLLVGDHLFVAKASYDIGIPFTNIKVLHVSDPKRGDVVVFQYPNLENNPEKEGQYYIKRLVGLPGDRIEVNRGVPYINGLAVSQVSLERGPTPKEIPNFDFYPSDQILLETLPAMDHSHWIQRKPKRLERLPEVVSDLRIQTGKDCIDVGKPALEDSPFRNPLLLNEVCPFTVPQDHFFMMGDNRDDSADSRDWGFVERKLFKGRALFIWLSRIVDTPTEADGGPFLRWSRLGLGIH